MSDDQTYVREEKWELFRELFMMQKRTRSITHELIREASSQYADLHIRWLLRIQDAMIDNGNLERIDISRLVELTEDSPQNLSRTLRTLEKEGLIERHTDPEDRRRTYLLMTDLGSQVLRETGKYLVDNMTAVMEQVGYESMRENVQYFNHVLELLENRRKK